MSGQSVKLTIYERIAIFLLFSVGVPAVMLIDLGVFKKDTAAEVTFREAGFWTGMWVLLAIAFYIFLGYNGAMVHGICDVFVNRHTTL